MKKLFATVLTSLFVVAGYAQSSQVEGTWAQLNPESSEIKPNYKSYLPDGRILGINFSEDLKNRAPWFMGTYEVLDDSTLIEHLTFHSSISFQRDIKQEFKRENDSILVSRYFNRFANAIDVPVIEAWKKVDFPIQEYAEHWDEMQQEALSMFQRVPPEGKTVEQYGDELYKAYEQAKINNLDRAHDILLVRAELDTTNLSWQRDMLKFYFDIKGLPAIADKIANRFVRLAEQQAPSPTDTSVISAYRQRAALYADAAVAGATFAEKAQRDFEKCLELKRASGNPFGVEEGGVLWYLSFLQLPKHDFQKALEYCDKAIEIFESTPMTSSPQKGEGYFLKGLILTQSDRDKESIDMFLNKAAPCFIDEQGKPMPKLDNEIFPYVFVAYGKLLCQNPKDKRLVKDFRQFMGDKIPCAVFAAQNERQLKGEYYIMEMNDWTIEGVNCFNTESDHFVIQKDGNHLVIDLNDDEKLGGHVILKTVDPSFKQQVIKNWKSYKKKQ